MDLARLASTLLTLPALLGVSLCALGLAYLRSRATWNARSRGLSLPPGPPLPLVGNMFDWPKSYQWAAFRDMSAKYVPVWKEVSAVSHMAPGGDGIGVLSAAHRFLNKLLTSPSKLREHVRFTFSAAILKVLFGVDVADDGDELIQIVEAALEWHDEAFVVGKYLVEAFPILKHIPPWVPGATLQRRAVYWRSTVARLKEEPFRRFKTGNGGDCAVGRMITRMVGNDEEPSAKEAEEIIRNVATVAIDGGSDTMFSTVQSVFIAMSLHPDVQKRAQAELDAVVGPNRLPDFEDRDMLVYVNALIREALRWQNVLPFATPHKTLEDDEFRGYFVPAGTNILPNVWACMHDPDVYEDPDVFRPERFVRDGKLDFSTAPDPTKFIFGFGRRICPGRYFAENGLFINVASALHVFDITPPVDEKGQVIEINPQMTDGLLCYPVDCRCTIKPRSTQAEALIREAQLFY